MSFQSYFQDALFSYNSLGAFDIDSSIAALDRALSTYGQTTTDENLQKVKDSFQPIADYYTKLTGISKNLQEYLKESSNYVADSQNRLLNEERYDDKVHPEESTKSREIMYGLFPLIRVTSLPYLLAAGVFMACMTIFMVFQMAGVSGQLNLPPGLVQWLSAPATGLPFYKDPMVLSGAVIILAATVIIFAVLYFKGKDRKA